MKSWHVMVASWCAVALLACSSDEGDGASASSTATGAGGAAGETSTGGASAGGAGGAGGEASASTATSGGGGMPPPFSAKVTCGSAVCEGVTPVCCVAGGTSSCVAYMGSISCGNTPETTMFCDESGDCLAGQVCCVDTSAPAGGTVYGCAYAPCPTHEACVPGGSCGAGSVCEDDAAQASGAKCVSG